MSKKDSIQSGLTDRNGDSSYNAPRVDCKISDFKLLRRAGDGSFSTVVKSRYKADGNVYALKIIDKNFVIRQKCLSRILLERNILDKLQYDGVVDLKFTFQDQDNLYLVMEYIPCGELFAQIQNKGKLQLHEAQFYAAEVVLILEHLQSKNLIHRDLKPENLLLTENGHLKLVDFGCVKILGDSSITHETGRSTSFVGTADYVAPETLRNEEISFAVDLWGLGCLLFQMLSGSPPFRAASEYLTYEKISSMEYTFPDEFPPTVCSLIGELLKSDPQQRLGVVLIYHRFMKLVYNKGAKSIEELKNHVFFDGISWNSLRQSKAPDFIHFEDVDDDEEASELDWELTSLIKRGMRLV